MKKLLYILVIVALAVTISALPIKESEQASAAEDGWYVPQADGSLVWMTTEEGEQLLEEWENNEVDDERNQQNENVRGLTTIPIHYYLYTSQNPTDPQQITDTVKSISGSNFDSRNPTRFIIHGWTQGYKADMNTNIRDAWLSRGDYNIIVVDWSRARSIEYASSVSAVKPTGKKVAAFIDHLVKDHGMNLAETEVIGHSLGAHVAGFAGKNIVSGKLHTIVGLDPALPLFSYKHANKRLSSDDAEYVETIQTNGGKLGFLEPIGKGAFYPNGGQKQPGCGLDLTGACSHGRSCTYYAEAVAANSFVSVRCGDYKEAVKENCGSTYSSVKMGSTSNAFMVTGEYYVPVRSAAPFGFGS